MITRIGIVAGEIWHFLDENGSIELSALKKKLEYPDDIIVMSIGWLAREGHIILDMDKGDYKLTLRK